VRLTKEGLEPLIAKAGSSDSSVILQQVSTTTKGQFEKGYNLVNYIDWRYLPGRKYDTYFDPEGILNACTIKERIIRARTAATNRASVQSRSADLRWILPASDDFLRNRPTTWSP
jgi:hypothetical protein